MTTVKKFTAKVTALLLALSLALLSVPQVSFTVFADDDLGSVRVIVENTTFTEAVDGGETPAWTGTKVDKWVSLDKNSSAMTCIKDAIESSGFTQTGADAGYISEIAGLKEKAGGSMSGWMGTLNDWFTNAGFDAYTVANGKLTDGDELRMQYTMNWGADLGSEWGGTDTSLKAINSDYGTLSPEFSAKTYDYTLTVPFGTKSINFRPTALNRNFKTVSKIGDKTLSLTKPTEIKGGDVITVTVGEGKAASTYKVTVKEGDRPVARFDSFALSAFSLDGWDNDAFDPEKLEYDIKIKSYSTSSFYINSGTKFNNDLLKCYAVYTDINGVAQRNEIKSGSFNSISNIPFGLTKLILELCYIDDESIKTQYVFNITRPYDYTAEIASSGGITLIPGGRELYATKYNGFAEGTVFRNDENGNVTDTTGTNAECHSYTSYILGNTDSVALTLKGKTANVHFRAKTDGEYTELKSGETTPAYSFGEDGTVTVSIDAVSDGDYLVNKFDDADKVASYTIKLIKADASVKDVHLTELKSVYGDLYPAFDPSLLSYNIVIANDAEFPTVYFKAADGCTVTIDSDAATAGEDGYYSLVAKSGNTTVTISNGTLSESYTVKATKRSKYDVPDKVVDYLCINSQYTNVSFGVGPEQTLTGTMKSLGNFGGYITYYYDDPITDDPSNPYGLDFYAYGNSFVSGGSAAESGQVYVSEDGKTWYALAGSEHFEDTTITDYEVTYKKTADGKTSWTDNQGNSNDGSKQTGRWVSPSVYYMNDLAKGDTVTLRGVVIPGVQGTIQGDSSTASFVGTTRFGYVDYFKNGTIGANVNAYSENAESNGFDLKWAVDENGNPVTFKNGVHYIKIQTASNIWAGIFNEKSTEVSYVVRTTANEEEVGTTALPGKIVLTDANGKTIKELTPDDNGVYEVSTGVEESVSISVAGAADDNIYVNNQRIAADGKAEIAINSQSEIKTVRIIVQNGEKQPVYAYLKLVPDDVKAAEQVEELIDAIGDVTLDSYDNITAARTAYDKLSDNAKTLVGSYETLTAAEEALAQAEADAVSAATDAIDGIGNVTADSKEKIDSAKDAYSAVPERLRDKVTNAETLDKAIERFAAIDEIKQAGAKSDEHKDDVISNLSENKIYPLQSIGGEWSVIALARAGKLSADKADKYYNELCDAVKANGSDRLSDRKPTENARAIIALSALGKNSADVAGYNLLSGLDDMDYITSQGINAAIFALIAFDTTDYSAKTHDELIAYITDNMTGNGWALAGDAADVDLTAMALQALAPYAANEKVKSAINSGLEFLSESLDENARYVNGSESTSQVLIALAALGIDPITDSRFTVDGITLIDALESYATESGYSHVLGGEENYMATEQATLALTAYKLYKDGSSLYNMNVKAVPKEEPGTPDDPTPGDSTDKPEKPDEPTPGDSTDKPEKPDEPTPGDSTDKPEKPDEPTPGDSTDKPEKPDEPSEPGKPDEPGKPGNPDKPVSPDTGVVLTGGMALLLSGAAMLLSKKKRK